MLRRPSDGQATLRFRPVAEATTEACTRRACARLARTLAKSKTCCKSSRPVNEPPFVTGKMSPVAGDICSSVVTSDSDSSTARTSRSITSAT